MAGRMGLEPSCASDRREARRAPTRSRELASGLQLEAHTRESWGQRRGRHRCPRWRSGEAPSDGRVALPAPGNAERRTPKPAPCKGRALVEPSGIALVPRSGTRLQLGEAEMSNRQPGGAWGPTASEEVRGGPASIGNERTCAFLKSDGVRGGPGRSGPNKSRCSPGYSPESTGAGRVGLSPRKAVSAKGRPAGGGPARSRGPRIAGHRRRLHPPHCTPRWHHSRGLLRLEALIADRGDRYARGSAVAQRASRA